VSEEIDETPGPVIRDKRRIDPETGQLREPRVSAAPSAAGTAEAAPTQAGQTDVEVQLAERTADLQRLQAEYVNYKRRVDRDREATRQASVASVLTSLLPVLDDIGRAREHEELTGGFKAVAESLERTVAALGLVSFGEVGDEFDPRVAEVDGPVCVAVLQVGYRLGDRIVRPARVAVAEPEPHADADGSEQVPTGDQEAEELDALTPDSDESNA
jgi:molecular chaperone GrpE